MAKTTKRVCRHPVNKQWRMVFVNGALQVWPRSRSSPVELLQLYWCTVCGSCCDASRNPPYWYKPDWR